jgi:hypothetical protein
MTFEDRVLQRFADANPVPDSENLVPSPHQHMIAIERRRDAMTYTTKRPIDPDRVLPPPPRRRRVSIALAAAAVVAVSVAAVWLATGGNDESDTAAAAESVAVVVSFHDRWNAGDVEGALALTSPDFASVGGGRERTENFMEYVAVFIPEFGTWVLSDCVETEPAGTVECFTEFDDPMAEALGISGSNTQYTVREGQLARLGLPNYDAVDIQLKQFASAANPEGTEENCGGIFWYTPKCGEFLVTFVDDFLVSLETGS